MISDMKAEELMIGDWVYDSILKGNTKVVKLDLNEIKGEFHVKFYEEDSFDPIPLTEDILKKNDFKWLLTEPKSITYCINEPTIHVTYYKDSQEWLICVGPSGSIKKRFVEVSCVKYVHELQHALRLCGINKEIVL